MADIHWMDFHWKFPRKGFVEFWTPPPSPLAIKEKFRGPLEDPLQQFKGPKKQVKNVNSGNSDKNQGIPRGPLVTLYNPFRALKALWRKFRKIQENSLKIRGPLGAQ